MKTKEELNALKTEIEALNKKLAELTVDELKMVSGGIVRGFECGQQELFTSDPGLRGRFIIPSDDDEELHSEGLQSCNEDELAQVSGGSGILDGLIAAYLEILARQLFFTEGQRSE